MSPQRSFPARPESIAAARSFVGGVTEGLDAETRDDVALMVSELCTNAVVHGDGPFVVTVERTDRDMTVTVADRGPGGALLRRDHELHPAGRGLRIVEELSDEWGSRSSVDDETAVWFRLELAKERC